MSYRPKGLDMKRLEVEEEDSNLESDANISHRMLDGEESLLGDKLEIGQCLLENTTMFTGVSKASKASKRDVDGIKTQNLDF